jgi:hypothetical protein
VPIPSAIQKVKAYLAINDLQEPSSSVSAYRHASPQAFQSGRKATARKVHALGFYAPQLFFSPFFQPPVDGSVLVAYSPCRFMALHAFSYQGFVSV